MTTLSDLADQAATLLRQHRRKSPDDPVAPEPLIIADLLDQHFAGDLSEEEARACLQDLIFTFGGHHER